MTQRTHRSNVQLMASVDNTDHLVHQAVGFPQKSDDENHPMGREENTSNNGDLMTRLLEDVSDRMDTNGGSLKGKRGTQEPTIDSPENQADVRATLKDTLNQIFTKYDGTKGAISFRSGSQGEQ